ncbi:MAG: KH domain-containing protein [Caldimicrobium sp.]
MSKLKDLVEQIAKVLVDKPEAVQINEIEGEQTSVIELKVAKEDLGKIIGKEGRTAKAIRTIFGAAGSKLKKRVVLEIIE